MRVSLACCDEASRSRAGVARETITLDEKPDDPLLGGDPGSGSQGSQRAGVGSSSTIRTDGTKGGGGRDAGGIGN